MPQEDKVHAIDDAASALVKDVTVTIQEETQKVDDTLLVPHPSVSVAQVGATVSGPVVTSVPIAVAPVVGVPQGINVNASVGVATSAPVPVVSAVVPQGGSTVGHVVPAIDVKHEDMGVDGLIEVRDAMKEANEVFNRVKSEKIAEQALCSIRNDQQQYEGLAKEIVGKAIKQKERERANRASAAASRAKVMRYQTELESRLNRVEAERNAYRRELHDLKSSGLVDKSENMELWKQHHKLQGWLRKMMATNMDFVRSIIAQDDIELVFGDKRKMIEVEGVHGVEDGEESEAKKRRI